MAFHNDFKLQIFTSRSAAVSSLQPRCAKNVNKEVSDLWKFAWQRYKMEMSRFIKPDKCFSRSDPEYKEKVKVWRKQYKALTVKHFLPYYKAKLPFLSGKAKKRYSEVIAFLNAWKSESDIMLWDTSHVDSNKVRLPSRVPPSQLEFPRPPRFPSISVSLPRPHCLDPTRQADVQSASLGCSDSSSEDEILTVLKDGLLHNV